MSYEMLIFYSVVTSVITLERVDLKKRVVDAPEILTVIDSIPNLTSFLNSLYMCQYGAFFKVSVACNHADHPYGHALLPVAASALVKEIKASTCQICMHRLVEGQANLCSELRALLHMHPEADKNPILRLDSCLLCKEQC